MKHLMNKTFLFHQHNAPDIVSVNSMAKIVEWRCDLLFKYSSFVNMMKWLGGKRFAWNIGVITETKVYFTELEKSYF